MDLTPQAIDNLVEALREYHAIYSPLFQRREQREGAKKYLHGLLLDILRKSIEPMVLALDGLASLAERRRPGAVHPDQCTPAQGLGQTGGTVIRQALDAEDRVPAS
jgi:hypothetical protein